jgi:hypothetical protein
MPYPVQPASQAGRGRIGDHSEPALPAWCVGRVAQRVRAKRGPMTGSGVTRHCRKAKTADYTELKFAYELLFRVDVYGFSRHAPQDYPLLMNGLLRVPAIIGSACWHKVIRRARREAATVSRRATKGSDNAKDNSDCCGRGTYGGFVSTARRGRGTSPRPQNRPCAGERAIPQRQ